MTAEGKKPTREDAEPAFTYFNAMPSRMSSRRTSPTSGYSWLAKRAATSPGNISGSMRVRCSNGRTDPVAKLVSAQGPPSSFSAAIAAQSKQTPGCLQKRDHYPRRCENVSTIPGGMGRDPDYDAFALRAGYLHICSSPRRQLRGGDRCADRIPAVRLALARVLTRARPKAPVRRRAGRGSTANGPPIRSVSGQRNLRATTGVRGAAQPTEPYCWAAASCLPARQGPMTMGVAMDTEEGVAKDAEEGVAAVTTDDTEYIPAVSSEDTSQPDVVVSQAQVVAPPPAVVASDPTVVAPATKWLAAARTVVAPVRNAVKGVGTAVGAIPAVVASLPSSPTPVTDVITAVQALLTSDAGVGASLARAPSDLASLLGFPGMSPVAISGSRKRPRRCRPVDGCTCANAFVFSSAMAAAAGHFCSLGRFLNWQHRRHPTLERRDRRRE